MEEKYRSYNKIFKLWDRQAYVSSADSDQTGPTFLKWAALCASQLFFLRMLSLLEKVQTSFVATNIRFYADGTLITEILSVYVYINERKWRHLIFSKFLPGESPENK